MVLGIPVVEGHDLTRALLDSLGATVTGGNFKVLIIDNASKKSYSIYEKYDYNFEVRTVGLATNQGYYQPLKLLADEYPDEELIGLIHNDMVIYERGWNERMEQCFKDDDKLALVGLCGSSEIDERGGRGGGTVCYFRGGDVLIGDATITGQSQDAGRRTNELVPSACLDSLFMMFRREAIPDMENDWANLPLAHFIDRIWPCRLIRSGWHVATLGVECDHLGGMTTTGSLRFRDDCIKWLKAQGVPYDNPETELYLEAERRYFKEFKDTGFFPLRIRPDYTVERR